MRWFDLTEQAGASYRSDFRVGGQESITSPPGQAPAYGYLAEYRDIVPDERIVVTYEMTRDGRRLSISVATVQFAANTTGTPPPLHRAGGLPRRAGQSRQSSSRRRHPAGPPRRPAALTVTEALPEGEAVRKLVVTQNITADGSIEMLENWFDPQGQADMADLAEESQRQDAQADALLLGRHTFEAFRGYWRDLTDDTTGVSAYLNSVEKYVVSGSITDPDWDHTTVLTGVPVDEVQALKHRPGADIVLTGSIRLTHTVISAGLVDEYRLFVYPAVQGRGQRLFPDGAPPGALRLLEARAFTAGIVLLRYAPS